MKKRESERDILAREIVFSVYPEPDRPQHSELLGIVIDSSPSGFCIISSSPLSKGKIIQIKKGHLQDRKTLAEVKWAIQVSCNIYKAGLVLISNARESK